MAYNLRYSREVIYCNPSMTTGSRAASALLFLGDTLVFAFSLWLTLLLRYQEIPSDAIVALHAGPFAFLFIVWLLVFFMSGLYEKRVVFFKRDLSGRLIRTQVFNIVLAALFFFTVPALVIAPKTNLAIYLAVSLVLILVWRLNVFPRITERRTTAEAIIIGTGDEERELAQELNGNPRYGIRAQESVDPGALTSASLDELLSRAEGKDIHLLIVDTRNPAVAGFVPALYRRAFEHGSYEVVDLLALYEEVFDRVPLTLLSHEWFFRYISGRVSGFYLAVKRAIDITGGVLMGAITVVMLPFVWMALRIEGPGPLFIVQDRLGQRESRIRTYKIRTMTHSDNGEWIGEGKNRVTKVGAFLRRTSLDEFPQFVNVLKGELSLIGPRNDVVALGERLAEALPYYRVRYVAKPGITGWAQVNQQYEQGHISPQSVEETKMRLAYDFYYLKHRSLVLDIVIALKTVKRMLFRVGSW